MSASLGSFTFVLHSHLPYVISHGQWPHGMDWIHEATLGCYLPLIRTFRSLAAQGKNPSVTLGVTPVLAEQLSDPEFLAEFDQYLKQRLGFAQDNWDEFSALGEGEMAGLAEYWLEALTSLEHFFNHELGRDIIGALRELSDSGYLEIITCGATHGYFPLLSRDASIRFQVGQAILTHEHHFGKAPQGIWLPECAYRPAYAWTPPVGGGEVRERVGIEEILHEYGLDYFIIDSHLLKGGEAIGTYLDRFKALEKLWARMEAGSSYTKSSGDCSTLESYWIGSREGQEKVVAAFARDPQTALTVWSAEVGYPGDGCYLDFHKKHFPGGLKYWRVTRVKSDLAEKEIYEPAKVEARLEENAAHFAGVVKSRLASYQERTGRPGHLVAPFDTELFGHWWYEGPRFLEKVLSKLADDPRVELKSCGQHLAQAPPKAMVSLPEGSWGQGGFHFIWLNEETQWTWTHLYECEEIMASLLALPGPREGVYGQVVEQAARELLLLQASDWQFLISTWSARDYAEMRFSNHVADFKRLAALAGKLSGGGEALEGDLGFLQKCQSRDRLFPRLALDAYRD